IAVLTGGAGANHFSVASWTGTATIDGGTASDAINVVGTSGDDAVTFSGSQITVAGATINVAGIENVTLDGSDGTGSLAGSFGNFTGSLTLKNFEAASFVSTNFNGALDVQGPGVIGPLTVSGTVSAASTITAIDASDVTIGTLAGTMTVGSLHHGQFG